MSADAAPSATVAEPAAKVARKATTRKAAAKKDAATQDAITQDAITQDATTEAAPRRRYRSELKVTHLTPAERVARGRAARTEVPRSSHAVFAPGAQRPDPVELLERQARSRVPELVPIRYGRMLSSPFAFYRGAALGMAADLAGTASSGLRVQLCGDAHLSNFGVFASPERELVFDLNDFDETLPGPWEWDVKRLATSFEVAGRQNGFAAKENRSIVLASVTAYRNTMAGFAAVSNLEVWYARLAIEQALESLRSSADPARFKATEKLLAKAKTRDHLQAFGKLMTVVDGEPRFLSSPPLLVPIEEIVGETVDPQQLQEGLRAILRSYRGTLQGDRRVLLENYRFVQLARKVVGVGSVGTRCWVALFLGRDSDDPLLLQIKEAGESVLEEFVGHSAYVNAGQRVVEGQRLMQAASDIFLGWQRTTGLDGLKRDFFVRQLHDWKGSVEVEQMVPQGMTRYAQLCGWTLARAHARSGDRIAIAAYLGNGDVFDRAVADFASAYADQNERDHAALVAAVASGRLQAVTDV